MNLSDKKPMGIVSYGAKIPNLKISGSEIALAQGKSSQKLYLTLGVDYKTAPNIDEDTITLSTSAGFQALQRLEGVKAEIGALFIGSESHPYAVKPSGVVVAQALGLAKTLALADLQFACKAGTQALQISSLYVKSGFCNLAMAIGADTAQAKPGDVLEYTAGAGAAAFILGKQTKGKNNLLAKLIATTSVATDTPDFWRRPQQTYPEHAGRFTSAPGYFYHIKMAVEQILSETKLKPANFNYCVFHSPNSKFPIEIAKQLGFTQKQIQHSLLVKQIGNIYAGSSMLSLVNILDHAKANQKILVVSYGSGSGSDAFVFETTQQLVSAKKKWTKNITSAESLLNQVQKLTEISYTEYQTNAKN
jgi:hydroxymethylglutaryl-CoA synthase